MENPGCVGEEVPAVASSCYEEFSQPKVDEAKQEVTASSCPECGEALLRPEARFCSFCGSKLQLDKVPKQKEDAKLPSQTLAEIPRQSSGKESGKMNTSEKNSVHFEGCLKEHHTIWDRESTLCSSFELALGKIKGYGFCNENFIAEKIDESTARGVSQAHKTDVQQPSIAAELDSNASSGAAKSENQTLTKRYQTLAKSGGLLTSNDDENLGTSPKSLRKHPYKCDYFQRPTFSKRSSGTEDACIISRAQESRTADTSVKLRRLANIAVTNRKMANSKRSPSPLPSPSQPPSPSLSTFPEKTEKRKEVEIECMITDDENATLLHNMEDCNETAAYPIDDPTSKNSRRSRSREWSRSSTERTRTRGRCLDPDDIRLPRYSHALCFDSLKAIHVNRNGTMHCSYDRNEDRREPHALRTLEQFRGKGYNCISDDKRERPKFGKTKNKLGDTCFDSDDFKFLGCAPSKGSNAARQSEALPNPEQYTYVSEASSGRSGSIRSTRICGVCFDSDDFRVLACRHAICFQCLRRIYETNKRKIICPFDRIKDLREPSAVPKPRHFYGEIIYHISDDPHDFNVLIDKLIQQRKITVLHLRGVASNLSKKEVKLAISKVTGSATGIAGSVLTIIGIILTSTVVGAAVGVPLAIAGASIGVAGGATTGMSTVMEVKSKRKGLQEIQEDLDLDRSLAEQVGTVLQRASENPELATAWKSDPALVVNVSRTLPAFAKVGVTSAAGVELGAGAIRATLGASLHIAGIALAAGLIPLDLAQLVVSSRKLHKKKQSDTVKQLYSIADRLENVLRGYLVKEQYFQEVTTNDFYWAYILKSAVKKQECTEKIREGCTFKELRQLAEIIEYGRGAIPPDVHYKMQSEWFSKKSCI